MRSSTGRRNFAGRLATIRAKLVFGLASEWNPPSAAARVLPTSPMLATLHVPDGAVPLPPTLAEVTAWETFVGAFTTATGWTPRVTAAPAPAQRRDLCSFRWPAVGDAGPRFWTLEAGPQSGLPRERLEPLAKAAVDLAHELEATRLALWQREAELAAAVPVVPHRDEPRVLARKLEALLRSAADCVEGQAAALYLLDEATTELKLRAVWNLPLTRLLQPGRPLRGALADVEALSGHAVALEDTRLLPHWRIPEPDFAAAACVPVSSATTLLGTLWTFGSQVRDFTPRETNLLEIVAGRIAAELEREVLLQTLAEQRGRDQQARAARQVWQGFRPAAVPPLPGWDLAAALWPEEAAGGAFYDWSLHENGRLALALGEAAGRGCAALPTAATMLATLRAERARGASPATIVERTGDALLAASTTGERGALAAVEVEPLAGRALLAGGGGVRAIWSTRRSGALLLPETPLLGDLDARPDLLAEAAAPVAAGESLLLVNEALWNRWSAPGAAPPTKALAAAVRRRGPATAGDLLAQLRERTPEAPVASDDETPLAALLLRRLSPPPARRAPRRRSARRAR